MPLPLPCYWWSLLMQVLSGPEGQLSLFRIPSPSEVPLQGSLVPAPSHEPSFEVSIPRKVYFRSSIQSRQTLNRESSNEQHACSWCWILLQGLCFRCERAAWSSGVVLSHPSWDLDQAAPIVYLCCFVW